MTKTKNETPTMTLRLPREIREVLDVIASKEMAATGAPYTASDAVRDAIFAYLEAHPVSDLDLAKWKKGPAAAARRAAKGRGGPKASLSLLLQGRREREVFVGTGGGVNLRSQVNRRNQGDLVRRHAA